MIYKPIKQAFSINPGLRVSASPLLRFVTLLDNSFTTQLLQDTPVFNSDQGLAPFSWAFSSFSTASEFRFQGEI